MLLLLKNCLDIRVTDDFLVRTHQRASVYPRGCYQNLVGWVAVKRAWQPGRLDRNARREAPSAGSRHAPTISRCVYPEVSFQRFPFIFGNALKRRCIFKWQAA